MRIRCREKDISITCRDGRVCLCIDGESYAAPGNMFIPETRVNIKELFPDTEKISPGEWSREGFSYGPFYFGLHCNLLGETFFEVTDGITLFSEEVQDE